MPGKNYNPIEVGTYGSVEASEYLRIPYPTLTSWITGGLVRLPEAHRVSFINLVELHVLKGMRRIHRVPMQRIRRALQHVIEKYPSPHPLADRDFETDGVDIFINDLGEYINVSRYGQQGIKDVVTTYLTRIGRDQRGLPNSLYPFVITETENEPKRIVINPRVGFGKPVIAGTGISTAIVAGRFNARESIQSLAEEYELSQAEIEEAIRWESRQPLAA